MWIFYKAFLMIILALDPPVRPGRSRIMMITEVCVCVASSFMLSKASIGFMCGFYERISMPIEPNGS